MTALIAANVRRVRDLLDPKRRFVVPRFQRPYAWTIDEAGALLTDIDDARRRAERSAGAGGWFIGSVVLARPPDGGADRLVDGHQRLTTLTILLAVLRDLERTTYRLNRHILARQSFFSRAARDVILSLRELDGDFFYDAIQKPGATLELREEHLGENDAQCNVISVALRFRETLGASNAAERRRLASFALDQTQLIEVVAGDEEQAYRLFSVLNTRGKDLKPGDVLKSELLSMAPATERERLADLWDEAEAALGERHFGALFSHIRTIATLRKRERAVFAEIRDALDPLQDPIRFIEREISANGAVYRDLVGATLRLQAPDAANAAPAAPENPAAPGNLLSPEDPRSREANGMLRSLLRVRNRDWEPVALAFFSRAPSPTSEEALAFLSALERRAYILLLSAADENTRLARFRPALQAIKAGAPASVVLQTLEPGEVERRVAREVVEGPIGAKDRIRMPVLLRLDDYLGDGAVDYDAVDATVEHVLPRNPSPGSAWMMLWPEKTLRKRWVHRLGNLALLPRRRNASAANLDFDHKKSEYIARGGTTPFAITAPVLDETTWTLEVVQRRQKALTEAARRLWRL